MQFSYCTIIKYEVAFVFLWPSLHSPRKEDAVINPKQWRNVNFHNAYGTTQSYFCDQRNSLQFEFVRLDAGWALGINTKESEQPTKCTEGRRPSQSPLVPVYLRAFIQDRRLSTYLCIHSRSFSRTMAELVECYKKISRATIMECTIATLSMAGKASFLTFKSFLLNQWWFSSNTRNLCLVVEFPACTWIIITIRGNVIHNRGTGLCW